jgi:excinuclease UvrABC ATPase subunit
MVEYPRPGELPDAIAVRGARRNNLRDIDVQHRRGERARPGAGPEGGKIVATGTPHEMAVAPESVTGPWLADHLGLTRHR